MSEELWRIRKVVEATGLCRSTIYERMQQGQFPKNIKLGPQAVAWRSSEVQEWIDKQIAKAA